MNHIYQDKNFSFLFFPNNISYVAISISKVRCAKYKHIHLHNLLGNGVNQGVILLGNGLLCILKTYI